LKFLIFEYINVANISSITGFMLLLDMMCNEIKVLIFGIHCWSYLCTSTQLYIVGAYFYALLEH
jgi:hypothetical protein